MINKKKYITWLAIFTININFIALGTAEEAQIHTNYEKGIDIYAFGAEGWRHSFRGTRKIYEDFITIYDVIYRNAPKISESLNQGAFEKKEIIYDLYVVGPNTPKKLLLADHKLGDGKTWVSLSDTDYSNITETFKNLTLYTGEGGYIGAGSAPENIVERGRSVWAEMGGEEAILDFAELKKRFAEMKSLSAGENNIHSANLAEQKNSTGTISAAITQSAVPTSPSTNGVEPKSTIKNSHSTDEIVTAAPSPSQEQPPIIDHSQDQSDTARRSFKLGSATFILAVLCVIALGFLYAKRSKAGATH